MGKTRPKKQRGMDGRKKWARRHSKQAPKDKDGIIPLTARSFTLSDVPSMSLKDMPHLIDQFTGESEVPNQYSVIEACLRRILQEMNPGTDRSPHPEQTRTVRRLVFGKGDTLLIARTGFGKSLILHSFSILTGKITIQLIPLNKLGDQQLKDISELSHSKPCILNADSKRREHDLIDQIQRGIYTHVLLGPEQAVSKAFRSALAQPEFQSRIGLVAIDECHLIKQWESFRPEFTMLGQLRVLLRPDVLWFGCSGTLGKEAESYILRHAGFRSLGRNQWQTEVIRTSVNRDDLFICVRPIPRRKLGSFNTLYFLLNASAENATMSTVDTITPTPQRIPKTIVFIDSISKVQAAAEYLQAILYLKTATSSASERYINTPGSTYSVHNMISTFTAHVSKYDQEVRFNEFKSSSSKIRIMVATTSLGMGINILDIERIVNWKFPIGFDVCDVWQRIDRGGRDPGRTSQGYLLMPYWLFDSEGTERSEIRVTSVPKPRINRPRNSQLIESCTPGDISDAESIAESVASNQSEISENEPEVKYWTKDELERRANVPSLWKDIASGTCHRKPILTYLGEEKLPEGAQAIEVSPEQCCSRCNPSLIPPFTVPPDIPKPPAPPRNGTRAFFALEFITIWAVSQAKLMYNHPNRRFPMPATAFIDTSCLWQLAGLYTPGTVMLRDWLNDIEVKTPLLSQWQYRETHGDRLFELLQCIRGKVDEAYANWRNDKKLKAESKRTQETETQRCKEKISNLNAAERYAEETRQRDDTLAMQVARRQAVKVSELYDSIDKSPAATPSTPHRMTAISAETPRGPAYSPLTPIPTSGGVHTHPQSTPTPTTPPTGRKRSTQTPETPPSKRRPLGERDINKRLSFAPVSKSGRARAATPKGLENFRMG